MTLKFQYEPTDQVKKDFHIYLLMFYGKESELYSKVGMEMEDAIRYSNKHQHSCGVSGHANSIFI